MILHPLSLVQPTERLPQLRACVFPNFRMGINLNQNYTSISLPIIAILIFNIYPFCPPRKVIYGKLLLFRPKILKF